MSAPLAYLNGQWLPQAQAALPLHDAGFVMGATVTDLCRTFHHRLYCWPDHLARFRRSCRAAGIQAALSDEEITAVAEKLTAHNAGALTPAQDLALVVFATPGPIGYYAGLDAGAADAGATFGIHTFPLPFARYRRFHEFGISLVIPDIRHVPSSCVPPGIKQRSRMHWWLAAKQAHAIDAGAQALLLNDEDHVTETATANFLIATNGIVMSPPRRDILEGISLRVVEELCAELAIGFLERSLTVADCLSANEAFLTSTPYCLAGVSRFQGQALPWPGPIFSRLLQAWSGKVAMDIRAQICEK